MLPTKFWIIWPSSYRREEFLKSANQKQESPVAGSFRPDPLTNMAATGNSYF
jgi:hypothetical protein